MKRIKVFNSLQSMEKVFDAQPIRRLRIGNTLIGLAKTGEKYKAFDLLCPHQKHPLSEGTLNEYNEIVCPLHEYRFNLNTGKESSERSGELKLYTLEYEKDGVYILLPD